MFAAILDPVVGVLLIGRQAAGDRWGPMLPVRALARTGSWLSSMSRPLGAPPGKSQRLARA